MYPGEHASAIMPLQRWSEDRIWSVTFLAKLRDERSWRATTERVCNVNNCVNTILGGESERVQMKSPPQKKRELTHASRSVWLLSKPLMQQRHRSFHLGLSHWRVYPFMSDIQRLKREWTKIDQDQTLIMSEPGSFSKLSLVLYQKTVIYWLCCRGLNACVGASQSQWGKVTE